MIIVTAATKYSVYEACLEQQKAIYGDKIVTYTFPRMSWERGTKIKPAAIRQAFRKSDVVLWMDSDCWVDLPDDLPEGDWDICTIENIHPKHFHKISAAFILFRNTKRTRKFLDDWDKLNKRYPKDHPALIKALERNYRYVNVGDMTEWLKGRHKVNVLLPDRGAVDETGQMNYKSLNPLKIQILPCRMPLKKEEWPEAMAEGIAKYDDVVIGEKYDPSYDVHVFWGLKRQHYKDAVVGGKPFVVVERGYLGDRVKQWFSVGIGGLNGLADFNNQNVSGKRWAMWRDGLQPWQENGNYALVIGQVHGDASLYGIDINQWAYMAVNQAKRVYDKVVFRHHPEIKAKDRANFGVQIMQGPLQSVLKKAKCVITYSSNTAVEAIMAGIPAVTAIKGSMAWDVSSHNIEDPLIYPDREEWGKKLAYTQWSIDEMREGLPWKHLRSKLRG